MRRTEGGPGEKVDSFGSSGFIHQLNISGPVSSVTNCAKEDMQTFSRGIKEASLPSLWRTHGDRDGGEGGSVVATFSRTWTPTDT